MHFALILADAIHASLFISPESHSGKSLYNTIIFQLSPQTFAHLTKNNYLCTRNESTPWDYVFKGGRLQDIIKASIALCAWLNGTWKILILFQDIAAFDVLGICISISIRTIVVCMCAYISAWASVLLVRNNGQFQGLVKRNSNSASPAFFVSMINIIHKKHENTIKIQILEMAHRPQNKVCYYCVLQAQAYLS